MRVVLNINASGMTRDRLRVTSDDQGRDPDGKFASGSGDGSGGGGAHKAHVDHHSAEADWHEKRVEAIKKRLGNSERRGDLGNPGKIREKLATHQIAAARHRAAADLYREGKKAEAESEGRVAKHHARNVGRDK